MPTKSNSRRTPLLRTSRRAHRPVPPAGRVEKTKAGEKEANEKTEANCQFVPFRIMRKRFFRTTNDRSFSDKSFRTTDLNLQPLPRGGIPHSRLRLAVPCHSGFLKKYAPVASFATLHASFAFGPPLINFFFTLPKGLEVRFSGVFPFHNAVDVPSTEDVEAAGSESSTGLNPGIRDRDRKTLSALSSNGSEKSDRSPRG